LSEGLGYELSKYGIDVMGIRSFRLTEEKVFENEKQSKLMKIWDKMHP
jgi:hypothetical protein